MRTDRLVAAMSLPGIFAGVVLVSMCVDLKPASAVVGSAPVTRSEDVSNTDRGPVAPGEFDRVTTTTRPVGMGGPVSPGSRRVTGSVPESPAEPSTVSPVNHAWSTHIRGVWRDAQRQADAARTATTTNTTEAATPATKGN